MHQLKSPSRILSCTGKHDDNEAGVCFEFNFEPWDKELQQSYVVNYLQLKHVGIPRRLITMHSTRTNLVIETQKSVYRDSRPGNLDKINVSETLRSPLQDRFHSDSQRGFPVAVHDLLAFPAFVDGVNHCIKRLMQKSLSF